MAISSNANITFNTTGFNTDVVYTQTLTTFTTSSPTISPNWQITSVDWTTTADIPAEQWQVPDHFFEADFNGSCTHCTHNNVYRWDPSSHLPVIDEEPDDDDWRQLLAS
jgi:hypothetical protein